MQYMMGVTSIGSEECLENAASYRIDFGIYTKKVLT